MKTVFLNICGVLFLLLTACSEPVPETYNTTAPLTSSGPATAPATTVDTALPVTQAAVVADSIIPPAAPAAVPPPPGKASNLNREDLINFARQYLGTPYVYAASDPATGFDCSGFINYVYGHYQVPVPRSSKDFEHYGREISLEKATTGDLILFTSPTDSSRIGHIGIITRADNQNTEFIHASSGEAMAVTISSLSSAHYRKRFVKVIDVLTK